MKEKPIEAGDAASKKKHKPLSKKAKITIWSITAVVMAIIIAISIFLIVMAVTANKPPKVDGTKLEIYTANEYYAGTVGTINLEKLFPEADTFTNLRGSATLTNNIVSNITGDFTLNLGAMQINFTCVTDAVNVTTYDELYDNANTVLTDTVANRVVSKKVVIATKALSMTNDATHKTITLSNDLYGNGCVINAHDLVVGKIGSAGNVAFTAGYYNSQKYTIRDLQVIGAEYEETANLESYTNYGSLLDICGGSGDDLDIKAKVDVTNCIFERSHKVFHIRNAITNIEGTIIRTASDTTLSIGTFADEASDITIKNCVIADSLTAGILSYCYDKSITKEKDNANTWNNIKIEGFCDIYNWKPIDGIVFLPKTEVAGNAMLANIANTIMTSEVPKPEHADKKVVYEGEEYLHFGVIMIYSAHNQDIMANKSVVTYDNDSLGFKGNTFPIPEGLARNFIDYVQVIGYSNNADGFVKPTSKISDNANLYLNLRNGR